MVERVESFRNKSSQEAHVILPHEVSRKGVGNPSAPSSSVGMGKGVSRLHADRVVCKGCTDTPRGVT